jgi:alkylation response protein AidB-like acyl-CoA dehydrogenase
VIETRPAQRKYADLERVLRDNAAQADRWALLPGAVLAAVRASGILAEVVPAEHGGAGASALVTNRLVTQMAGADPAAAIVLFQHFAVSARIREWGTPAQLAAYLPRLAGGCLAASAWSESDAGADKRNISTTAIRKDDGWIINGTKAFTTGTGLADFYLVLARTGDAHGPQPDYGSDGQTFFLVDAANPGLRVGKAVDMIGMRASATGFLHLSGCVVPDDAVLGPAGTAASIIAGVRMSGATLGAVSVGIADAAWQVAISHVRQRNLQDDPVIRQRLAEVCTRIAAARAIVEAAGGRQTANPGITTLQSKVVASELAEQVCAEVRDLLGSAGFLRDHPIDRLGRDARAVALMGPTNQLCRRLIAAQVCP